MVRLKKTQIRKLRFYKTSIFYNFLKNSEADAVIMNDCGASQENNNEIFFAFFISFSTSSS